MDEYGSWEGPASSILACSVIVSFAKGLRKGKSAFVVVEMTLFSCQEVFQSSIWMDRERYLNEFYEVLALLHSFTVALSK